MKILGVAWENILVGLLSGLFVFLFSYAARRVREKILERKYPIAGEYLSEFEDEENGQIVITTAPAIWKQRGNKIYGETYMYNENRKWILEGHVSKAGHIHGIYYALDPHDRGIGNFFLYISHNRMMDGLWSGYDSVNQKITSGRYKFRPILHKHTLADLTEEDIPSIIAISDEELGKDYLTIENLKNIFTNTDGIKTFCKVALVPEHGVIGFCSYSIMTADDLKKRLKIPSEQIPKALMHSTKIGMIDVISVKNEFQRQGIGFSLVSAAIAELSNQQVSVICSIGWRSKKGVNIGGILRNHRFRELKEFENYWKEDSLKKNYYCHDCGNPPCTCSAIIFARFK